MNKYKKAIDTLIKSDIPFFVYKGQTEDMEAPRIFDFYHFEILTLRELVEKATPKKPIKVNDPNFDIRTCPCCGFRVVTHQNYCQGCGQKLRSEEE